MERRVLGKTGLEVSVLGFGGAEIGFAADVRAPLVREMLAEAIDAGLNLVDTAAAYSQSEALIGEALGDRRKDVYLVTKCGAIDGFARSDWSKAGIVRTIEQSLRNLRTDYLDVVLLHSCGHLEFLWGEAADGLRTAREKGYVRFIGYSGDSASAQAAVDCGYFDVLETSVNIADQEAIDLTLPVAAKANMGVIAKRPVANAAWRHATLAKSDYSYEYFRRLNLLQYPFLKKPMSEAVGVALRFTLAQSAVATAIVGTTKKGRWSENASLLKAGKLTETELDAVRGRWKEIAEPTWLGQV